MPTKELNRGDLEGFNLCGSLEVRVTLEEVFKNVHAIVVRERERMAAIFADAQMPVIAERVLDSTEDHAVFRWFDTTSTLNESLDSVRSEDENRNG